MSAVFTGNGLGLFDGRWAQGGLGDARIGQGADRQWVNVATGNLLLQTQDEQLLFRGLSIGQLRTYNSLGLVGQVGQDAWTTGFERRVELLSGSLNEAGSVLRRHLGDGSIQDFQYVAPNAYRSTSGEGAHDTLSWNATSRTWSYIEGSTRREEGYADHADGSLQGRLTRIRDLKTDGADPVTWTVQYNAIGYVSEVRAVDGTGGGDALLFTYDAAGRLSGVATREAGMQRGQVTYQYDGAGRLATVITDLTPDDGSGDRDTWDGAVAANNDGYLFRTDYTYDGASLRIRQLRQSDGTLVSYTYDAQGRIATLTRGDSNADDTDGAGQTLRFSYDAANRRTDVADSSGRTWSYAYDLHGRLTRVESPAMDGLRDVTAYAYDADGNLSQTQTTRGAVVLSRTDFQHDTNGNLLWQWDVVDPSGTDASARALQRTYTATNQLASETVFTGLDADGAGTSSAPQGGLTTRYLYDSSSRLRFVIGAAGDVRELTYASTGNGIGQVTQSRQYLAAGYTGTATLTALEAWATATQRASSTLVENTYDLHGRLSQTVAFANVDATGAGIIDDSAAITEYVYDAQGLLRQQVTRRSSTVAANDGRDTAQTTTYAYDGMGRILSEVVTQRTGTGATTVLRTTAWRHVDSTMTLVATVEGGVPVDGPSNDLLRTLVRNAAGQVVVSTESAVAGGVIRTSRNYYDASGRLRASEDAAGARTYFFHDAEGALVGEVDATGTVTVHTRNGSGHVVATTTHATRVDTSGWLVDGQVVPQDIHAIRPAAHAEDRSSTASYDAQGRVLAAVDAEGAITNYSYDGAGRLVQVRATDASATAGTARTTRYFHDSAGREIARLDAEGFLVEYSYDRAGRLVRTLAYATATSAALRAAGNLADLRPVRHADDQLSRVFHDGRGNRIAELDAEGHLTEYVFDEARNERSVRAHGQKLTGLAGNESLSELRTRAGGGTVRETRRSFDAFGNILLEVDAEGIVTRYTYDAQGRLLKRESAQGTSEVRAGHLRYDVFGNLIGELGGEGAAHLIGGMSEAQLDAVYAQYGVRHAYDATGQRIESIDAKGHKTWYFHDAAGRLTFTVRGVADAQGIANAAGEVTETRYSAFGDVRETIAYTGRIAIGMPGNRVSVADAVATLQYIASTDSRTIFSYDRRGLLKARIDAEQYRTEWRYSTFGDLVGQTDVASGVLTSYAYDRRGLRTGQVDDQGGLGRSRSWVYDAFGRVTAATDGRGHTVAYSYDRLGRQVAVSQTVGGRVERQATSYDAYDRVVSQTDASGRTTTYQYDDTTRGVVVTTAEGVTLTTQRNRHGETWKVVDGLGNATEYLYDRDGRLVETRAADGGTGRSEYSARGLMTSTVDATGRRVEYQYDAAGRVLKRIEDPAGLALTTTYAYDGQGRQITVTDAIGVRSSFAYDRKGQLRETVRDVGGLALKTAYTWDGQGRQLTVTEGGGTAAATTVAYSYDALGRRSGETIDPGAGKLNLTTTYTYDGNDNVVSRTDAAGRITRFTHDEANREVFRVDGAGGVVRTWYDLNGRVVATRGYAEAIGLQGLGLAVSTSEVQARLTTQNAKDVQSYRVHDHDGRLAFVIDGAGAVTTFGYDAAGRLVTTRQHVNAISLGSLRTALQNGTATAASVAAAITADASNDRTSYAVLDAVGRTRFTIGTDGAVVEQRYDLAGRATQTWAYATALTLTAAERTALAAGTFQVATMAMRLAPQASAARAQYVVHDAAGRERYRVDRSSAGKGVVSERVYDASGRVVADRRFGIEVGFDPTHREQDLATLLPASSDPASMRETRYVHDAAGRTRFHVDASGAVSESRYDASGRVIESREFGGILPAGVSTEAALAAWSQTQAPASVRSTRFVYDAAGRVKERRDALQKVERYVYDGTGLVTAYTDRNANTWNYEYDAAGRRTREISPQVTVAAVDANGNVTTATRRLTTLIAYDALGNVVSRTEDAGTAAARTTSYAYDNRGHQVRTTFPDAWRINEATGELEASGTTPTIEVVYDTLGRAVVQKDVRNHYSYRVYDQLDRVAYEIDQEGYVTGFGYNALGEQVTLRRHATRINTGALSGWTAGRVITLSDLQVSGVLTTSSADRMLSTGYDARGNKIQVVQSQVAYYNAAGSKLTGSPTTRFTYSAFGELIRESVLIEGVADQSSARWADTWRYYDALGRNVLTVDSEGYATSTRYSANGEVVENIEHALALDIGTLQLNAPPSAPPPGDAVSGYDRITRWEYDALGRKIGEIAVRSYQRADGSAGVKDVETRFAYDGEGRLTGLTTDAGTTVTRYDALGRTLSVQEPVRDALSTSAENSLRASTANDLSTAGIYQQVSPYTAMAYDAFGNLVQVRRFANGLKAGQSAPVADAARDQIHVTRYDRQGRSVMTRDAEGNRTYSAYDAADNLVHSWYRLTGSTAGRDTTVHSHYQYDRTGRQLATAQTRVPVAGGTAITDLSEAVEYNAFGEITRKTRDGLDGALVYAYDAAGRLATSNEGGATRVLGYNLAGHHVRESHKAYLGASGTVDAVTWNTTDRLGRVLVSRMPAHNAANDAVTVTQQLDRWGNAIEIIDGRGYQTRYQYNQLNQIIRDERPLVKVVSESGVASWTHPVNEWFYDALGRLVATRDANGNTRTNEYDNSGQLVRSVDALGNATRHAFDALGNQRLSQDPMGYLTFREYDRLNRVVAIGDYLPGASGTTRGKTLLQKYTLNQNGDRLRTEDALGYAALYDFDSRNLMLRSQTAMGVVLDFDHDVAGNRIRQSNAQSGSSTLVDRDNETVRFNELTWDYDIHGRLFDHNNLSGRDYDYVYDAQSGQLTTESSAGGAGMPAPASKSIAYYANGRVREIVENSGNRFRYEYDAAGNRTLEEVVFTDGSGRKTHTVTRTFYDSHNRIERVTQDELAATGTAKRVFDLLYEYDAVGNRRHVVARSGFGPGLDAVPVENTAPVVISKPADRVVRKGLGSEFRILFSDVFRDSEHDALSLLVAQSSGAALPAWLAVRHDAATGEVVFVANPPAGAADQDITVRLTARETANTGNAAFTDFQVRVRTNTVPVLVAAGTASVRAKIGQPWALELTASDYFRDLDVGDQLTLSIPNAAALPAWLELDTGHPSVVRLTGIPTAPSTFSFKLRATDQRGAYVEKTFQVTTAANAAPQKVVTALVAQEAIKHRDFDWTRNLAQIFTDIDGDPLQVTATGVPAWMTFQYLEDQATPQIRLAGNPPGSVADGTQYSIVLKATDPDGLSASITLSVTVRQNRAPVSTNWTAPSLRVADNYDVTLPISTLFNDPEGDQVFIEPVWPTGSTLPQWLNVSVDQDARTVRLHGRPASNAQAGSFTFQLRGSDADGLSAAANVSISVGTDNPPVRNTSVNLPDRALDIGRSFSFRLPAGLFTDPDGDPIRLVAWLASEHEEYVDTIPPSTLRWVNQDPLPAWLSFDPESGTFSGTVPAGTSPQSLVIRVRAIDSRGRINAVNEQYVGTSGVGTDGDITLTLRPFVNSAPVYNGGLPNRTLKHGTSVNFALPSGAFTEPNGDSLTYTAFVQEPGRWEMQNISTNPYEPEFERVWVEGAWVSLSTIGLAINASTGTISGTASNLTQANINARIVARDPQGLAATGIFSFSVTNTPPTASPIPVQTVGRNMLASGINLAPYFQDANADPLEFTVISGLPAGLTLGATGQITGSSAVALGSYQVTVRASDGRGGSVDATFTLRVENKAPVAPQIPNQTAPAGANWTYTIPVFTDPNNDALSYSISGSLPAWMTFDAGTRKLSGTPGPVGTWTVTVSVSDGTTSVSKAFTVTTPNAAPVVAKPITTKTAGRNTNWSYTVPADTFIDVNGDTLTYSVTGVPSGIAFDAATRKFSGKAAALGSYTITLTASDGHGGTRATSFVLKIVNNPPAYTAGSLPNREHNLGQAVSWPLPSGAFTDPNGDALAYDLYVLVPDYYEHYMLAPGEPDLRLVPAEWVLASRVGLSIASNGTISGKPGGLVYHPVADGYPYPVQPVTLYSYSLKVVAKDPSAAAAEGSFNLSLNRPPTANGGNVTVGINQTFSQAVPGFSDPEGGALTYTATLVGGGALPSWLSISVAGVLTGKAPAGGTWQLAVTARDSAGLTSTGTVTLRAYNNAPVYNSGSIPSPLSASATVSFSYQVPTGAFSDPNGDSLTYSAYLAVWHEGYTDQEGIWNPGYWQNEPLPAWLSFNASTRTLSGTPTTQGNYAIAFVAKDPNNATAQFRTTLSVGAAPNYKPVAPTLTNKTTPRNKAWSYQVPVFTDANGDTLTYTSGSLPAGIAFNASTRTFSGTPTAIGSYTLTVTANDGRGGVTSASFKLDVVNSVPVAPTIADRTVPRNTNFSYQVPAFTDGNNDALSYTVSSLPAGVVFTASTRTFSGKPTAIGNYPITVTVSDGHGGTASASFTLAVVNSAPVAPAIPNQTATAGTAWSYVVPAFTDANNDGLTYSVSGLPSWMNFNASTRTLSGAAKPAGAWTITVTASDGITTTSRNFTVTTPNVAPVLANAITAKSVGRNHAWSFVVPANTFTDANGDSLTYSASGMPAGVTFTPSTRTFSGTPTALGASTVTLTVQDGRGGTRSTTFTINVVNNPPTYTAGSLPSRAGQDGQAVSWALPSGAFKDANGDALAYSLLVLIPAHYEHYMLAPGEPDLRLVPAQWVPASQVGLGIASNGTISGTIRPLTYSSVADGYPHPVSPNVDYGYTLKIVAKDAANATAEGSFSVSVNAAPVAPALPNRTVKSAVATSWDFPAFSDANGDSLTYTVTGLPAGLSHPGGTSRRISGTPTASGTFTVKVTANDGKGGAATRSFTLTVQANGAPTAPAIPNQSATVGVSFSYTVPVFSDPNNDALTYTASGLPAGLSFNTSSRVISGKPTAAGNRTVTITANDGRGGTVSKTFTINVAAAPVPNRAPVINKQAASPAFHYFGTNRHLVTPQTLTLPVDTFVDADNNPLTYTVLEKPSWLSYSFVAGSGHRFTGVPSHEHIRNMTSTIRLQAKDPSGAQVVMTFSVTSEYDYNDPGNPTIPLGTPGDPLALMSFDMGAALAPEVSGNAPLESAGMVGGASIGPSAISPNQIREQWFTYDAENRIRINNGKLENGRILVKTLGDLHSGESFELTYDAAGREVGRMNYNYQGAAYVYRTAYDLRGQKVMEFHGEAVGGPGRGVSKAYTYDVAGRLVETRSYFASNETRQVTDQERITWPLQIGGWLSGAEQLSYDGDHRLTSQVTKGREDEWWNAFGNSLGENLSSQRTDLGVLQDKSGVYYTKADGSSGYDALGRVQTYRYRSEEIKWATHTYTSTYQGWDSYQEWTVTGSSSNTNYRTTTNTLAYDGMGRLLSQREKTNYANVDDRIRYYAYTGDGQVQLRREGRIEDGVFRQDDPDYPNNPKPNYLFVHAGGQQQAELKEGGNIRTRYGSYASAPMSSLNGSGRYEAGGGKVTVLAGETLRSLAQRIYGTPQLWYVLADANGMGDPEAPLTAGTQLNAPSTRVSGNDANTFKPYNPNEAIGSTSPSLPYIAPPPKKSCNTLAVVLMVVVAVVVSVVTYGAATKFFAGYLGSGTLATGAAAGATAGAASAAASGVVGSATGVASFSWRGVAAGAISGGITGGLASQYGSVGEAITTGGATNWTKAAGLALANAGANYAGQKLAGVDVGFSWRSIATSAVSSVVSAKVMPGLVDKMGIQTEFGYDFASGMTGGMVSAAVRSSFGQTLHRTDYMTVVADAFGNALGNRIARDTAATRAQSRQARAQADNLGVGTGLALTEPDYRPDWLYGDGGTTSFLGRYPDATASLGGGYLLRHGDVPQNTAIDVSWGNMALGPQGLAYDPSIRTLDTIMVVGNREDGTSTSNFAMWQWRLDYNRWADQYGHARISVGASDREAQAVYRGGQHAYRANGGQARYDQWVGGLVAQAGPLNHTRAAPNPYVMRYNAINGGIEAVDNLLAAIQGRIGQGRADAREWVVNAESWYGAGAKSVAYGFAAIGHDLLQGVAGAPRLLTNSAGREALANLIRDPSGALSGAWNAFLSMPMEEQASALGAMLLTGGTSAARMQHSRALGHNGTPLSRQVNSWEDLGVANSVERVSSRPQWLQRLDAGNAFNAERAAAYPYNEVYINKPGGSGYYRLDSYSPAAGEIVSRKFTQFADIQPRTALGYVNEIPAKYPVDGVIANVPSSGQLSGQILRGQYILEVPVQVRPIPQSVLDGANRAGVLIRDVNGRIY